MADLKIFLVSGGRPLAMARATALARYPGGVIQAVIQHPRVLGSPRSRALLLRHPLINERLPGDLDQLGQVLLIASCGARHEQVRGDITLDRLLAMFGDIGEPVMLHLTPSAADPGRRPTRHEAPRWRVEVEPDSVEPAAIVRALELPMTVLFTHGADGPWARLVDREFRPASPHDQQTMRRAARCDAPGLVLTPDTFCELVRNRLIEAALRCEGAAPMAQRELSGLRLARLLYQQISGQGAGADRLPPLDREATYQRALLRQEAMRQASPPSLPQLMQRPLEQLDEGCFLIWRGGLYSLAHHRSSRLKEVFPGSAQLSLSGWVKQHLLEDASGPRLLAGLVRLPPQRPPSDADEDARDAEFLQQLRTRRRLVASSPIHRGIEICWQTPDKLKVQIEIPEHLADTGIPAPPRNRHFIHWPRTHVGVELQLFRAVPHDGRLKPFHIWDTRFKHHALCSITPDKLAREGGTVCVADSAELAAQEALALGRGPGEVLACQLIEVRDSFLFGYRSDNPNGYFHNYFKIYSKARAIHGTEFAKMLPFELIPEAVALRMARQQKISLANFSR